MTAQPSTEESPGTDFDLGDIKGQESAKRALEVAAAGGHHLLILGPPGVGKTMLARALQGLLPPPLGTAPGARRPLRELPPSTRPSRLVSGARGLPSESELAEGGILFLDHLPAYSRRLLALLSLLMEVGRPFAVAATAPSLLGIPAFLTSRFEMAVALEAPVGSTPAGEFSEAVAKRVADAFLARQAPPTVAELDRDTAGLLETGLRILRLSPRGVLQALAVGRTVATLAGSVSLRTAHLAEALQYRPEVLLQSMKRPQV